jgi:hypothetical protein
MIRRRFLGLVGAMILTAAVPAAAGSLDPDGRIVFSNRPIPRDLDSRATLKDVFQPGQTIWARAFFQRPLGPLTPDQHFFYDLWIDGRRRQRLVEFNPDPAWDQFQVYVHQTGSDDFDPAHFRGLEPGTHRVRIVIGLEKPHTTMTGIKEYESDVLAEGGFEYVVE